MNPIPYGKQCITQDDINAVVNTLTSDFLTQGPTVERFEKAFSEYIGCKYAVAVSNGTAALHLAALALGVNENSRVITTPITFAASANCIRYCGGQVSFVDIDKKTAVIDIEKLEALLKSSPKGTYTGIIPVDFAGYPVNMEAIRSLADEYNLWIIEDACHAPGGFFVDSKGERQFCGNGRYADLSIFSFHPVKHIACGEGGMITTNNEGLFNRLQMLRTHGITKDQKLMHENHGGWYYEMQCLGYNYRLTDFQAALGISQLRRAKEGLERRRYIAGLYNTAFANTGFLSLTTDPDHGHAYHLYVIRTSKRKELYDFLRSKNIFTQVHYLPVHLHPYYKDLGFSKGMFQCAEAYYDECLSLPMFPSLTERDIEYVIGAMKAFDK